MKKYTLIKFSTLKKKKKKKRIPGQIIQANPKKKKVKTRSLSGLISRKARWDRSPWGTIQVNGHAGPCTSVCSFLNNCLLRPLLTLDNFSFRVYPNVAGHFHKQVRSMRQNEVKECNWITVKSLLLLIKTHTHTHTHTRHRSQLRQ